MNEALLDRVALRDLVMRYCRGVDRRDFALVRALYHDDAVDDHGAMFCGGPEAFVAWLPEAMARWELTCHSISNSLFAVDGDRAEGEHHVTAYHRTHPPKRREFIVQGRYLDQYERRGGEWKFAHRSLVFDDGEIREVDEEAMTRLGADTAHGAADMRDLSWRLPLLARLGKDA
jgi:3-phenylpropionate/cinnamic acid dioxygenase small subunit